MAKRLKSDKETEVTRIIVKNIYYFCKKDRFPLRKLEEKCNLSVGFFSRVKKDANLHSIPVYTIIVVCETFHVSLDDLVSKDFEADNRVNEIMDKIAILNDEVRKLEEELKMKTLNGNKQ